jgi:hypothetical protein
MLDMLARADHVAWERYEPGYQRAFGRASSARSLVERHRAGDASAALEFEDVFVFGDGDAGSFPRFQAKFDLIIAGSRIGRAYVDETQRPAAIAEIREVARRVLIDQRDEGIGYAEQRFFFGRHATSAFVDEALGALLEDYARAPDGITARLAVSLPREDAFLHWPLVQKHALGPHGHALTGVDFCFFEEGFPQKHQRAFFAELARFNAAHPERALAVLYHVGESFEDKSLESAVRWVQEAAELGAHRLGHAIALGVDPEAYGAHVRPESVGERRDQIAYDLRHCDVLRRAGVHVDVDALERERALLAEKPESETLKIVYDHRRLHEVRARQRVAMAAIRETGAVIEVCPTSNLRIGGLVDPKHHPVHRFYEEGLPFVVASDDPGIFGTRLRDEIDWVAGQLGLDAAGRSALAEAAYARRSEVLTGRVPNG